MSNMFTTAQSAFRGRGDTVAINTDTWDYALNTNFTQDVDTNFRVRFLLQETGNLGGNFVPRLRYQLNGVGGFLEVTATSSVIRPADGVPADGAAVTSLLGGTGTYANGAYDEVDGLTGTHTVAALGRTEVEFCIQIRSADVVDNDTIELRVYGKTASTTVLDAYTNTPTVTANVPGVLITPAVVAAVADVPAVLVWITPATVAAVASVPAPQAVGGLVGPVRWGSTDAQWGSTAAQWGGGSGDATVTPAAVAAVATVPAVSVSTGTNATVTPAVVAAVAAVPAVTVQAGATVTATVVAAVASVPTVTVLIRTVSDWSAVVTATATGGSVTISPDAVRALADVPNPNVTGEAFTIATIVAAVASVPSVTVTGGALVTPGTVAATTTIPAVTVSGAALVTATAVEAVASIPSVTLTRTALVVAATVAAIATVPAPSVSAGGSASINATTVAAVAAVPAPTPSGAALVAPAVIAAVASVPAPTVTIGTQAQPSTVAAIASVPAVAVGGVVRDITVTASLAPLRWTGSLRSRWSAVLEED